MVDWRELGLAQNHHDARKIPDQRQKESHMGVGLSWKIQLRKPKDIEYLYLRCCQNTDDSTKRGLCNVSLLIFSRGLPFLRQSVDDVEVRTDRATQQQSRRVL
jgi:hypothetical protein